MAVTPKPSPGSTPKNSSPGGLVFPSVDLHNISQPLLWFIGAVALVAAAGPFPQAATWVVLILIFLVLLKNWQQYSRIPGIASLNTTPSGG